MTVQVPSCKPQDHPNASLCSATAPSRVVRGPFPLLQHLELLLAPQGVLGKAGSWEAAREAPLTLIGCLVTNCATRMGLRLKETQSWTEGGCELPSKRCAEHRDTLGGALTPQVTLISTGITQCLGLPPPCTWARRGSCPMLGAEIPAQGLNCHSQGSARRQTALPGQSGGGQEDGFNSSFFLRAHCPFLPIFTDLRKTKGAGAKPRKQKSWGQPISHRMPVVRT